MKRRMRVMRFEVSVVSTETVLSGPNDTVFLTIKDLLHAMVSRLTPADGRIYDMPDNYDDLSGDDT